MEKIEKISEFVSVFTGYGYGNSNSNGYGDGSGNGSGYGSGYGSSSGYGYGDGYGDGYGYGFGSGYGSGSGYGPCYGSGNGNGYGYGSGYGSGYGYDDGSGYGDGSGDGDSDNDGYGIKSFCGMPVMVIDNVATIILQVRGNIAKGIILNGDLTTTPCYIVKQNNMFAHGNTLHEARESLLTKLFEDMPEEEHIAEFIKEHKPDTLYPATDFCSYGKRKPERSEE